MYTVYNNKDQTYNEVEEPDPSLRYTYADYLKWNFEEQVELIRGHIFKLSAPRTLHQQVSMRLSGEMYLFVKGHRCQLFSAPFDVCLPVRNKKRPEEITTVVQPDVCIVCDPEKLGELGCTGAPDLVVEILSPGNSKKEVKLKHAVYEEAGVREYWIVNPVEENIAVFVLNNAGKYDGAILYAAGDVIRCAAVEGLLIQLDDIFPPSE